MNNRGFQISAEVKLKHGKLYLWIKENNLTNASLSRLTGIGQGTIGHYVNMQGIPSDKNAEILELITGIPKDELFPIEYRAAIKKETFKDYQKFCITKNIPLQEMLDWQSTRAIEPPDITVDISRKMDVIKQVMSKVLTTRESEVISKRFFDELYLAEIGKDIGVTIERVRQIEHRALQKLREGLNKRIVPNYQSYSDWVDLKLGDYND